MVVLPPILFTNSSAILSTLLPELPPTGTSMLIFNTTSTRWDTITTTAIIALSIIMAIILMVVCLSYHITLATVASIMSRTHLDWRRRNLVLSASASPVFTSEPESATLTRPMLESV